MQIKYFEYTDNGGRNNNQDAIKLLLGNDSVIACIADGVGGALGGEIASSKSIELFLHYFALDGNLTDAIYKTHREVLKMQNESNVYKSMATTLTCCQIIGNKLRGVHVGDTRLCILRGNGIKQLTYDHTELNRLFMLGLITDKERLNYPRKNIIESAIGIHSEIVIQDFSFELKKKDRVFMSTDGVHGMITKTELRDMNKHYKSSINDFAKKLIDVLKNKELMDNTSFILLEI